MKEVVYLDERFEGLSSFHAWEKASQDIILSPSRVNSFGRCPRLYKHRYVDRLKPREVSGPLRAGSVIHAGLDRWYLTGNLDEALDQMSEAWGDAPSPTGSDEHLGLPHMEVVVKNYAEYWKRHGTHKPVEVRYGDLKLDRVLAAKWRMTDEGLLILSESPMLMDIGDEGDPLYVQGLPDMPVENWAGNVLVMDHKSTSSWISPWWKQQYRISDQFRLYTYMLNEILPMKVQGATLDAIYVGKYATSTKSKATKFDRDDYTYDMSMLGETRDNYTYYRDLIVGMRGGYYPQNPGSSCRSCDFLEEFCKQAVWSREVPPNFEVRDEFTSILER